MKILITGGAGFIGSRLCGFLASRGTMVASYDLNHSAAVGVDSFRGTILDGQVVGWILNHFRPDVLIHAAGFLGVQKTEREPAKCLEINIDGTKIVSQQCALAGVQHLIYLSSSEVYGAARECPTPETAELLGWSPYAVSKIAAEWWVRSGSTPYTIVRPFNIYGPGQREDFVIPRFIGQALAGEVLTVYGSGSQVRSFCYVDDFCHAVEAMLRNPAAQGGAFNVGSDVQPIEMVKLAVMINQIAGRRSITVAGHKADRAPSRDLDRRIPCTDKAFNLLGWQPDTSLADGLARCVQAAMEKTP